LWDIASESTHGFQQQPAYDRFPTENADSFPANMFLGGPFVGYGKTTKRGARRNIRKAARTAKRKRTVAGLPKRRERGFGQQAA